MFKLVASQRLVIRVIRHVSLLLVMVFLFSWVAWSRSADELGFWKGFAMVSTNALFFFGYAYLTVYLLIPHLLVRRRVVLFVLAFLATGIGLSLLKFLFSDFIFYQAIAPENGSLSSLISLRALLVNTKDMTFIVALFALFKFARDHYALESNIRELQQKGIEAELKLIEHQMDPHVIFNNFNNLYSISIYRPEYLKSTVKRLKAILHYLFMESRNEKVLLVNEIGMIENYIGLEQLRFGERLKVDCSVEGDMLGLRITPLILYSFVENCFVHGAGEDPSNSWIKISITVKDSRLCFYAANSVRDNPGEQLTGNKKMTNENSVRRLELEYPNSHSLTIREKRKEHLVELNISL
jgi:two-component system LytT family sensor kinase